MENGGRKEQQGRREKKGGRTMEVKEGIDLTKRDEEWRREGEE
jgi:hypothetical protein